jgi:hypothetical protein
VAGFTGLALGMATPRTQSLLRSLRAAPASCTFPFSLFSYLMDQSDLQANVTQQCMALIIGLCAI